MVPPRAHATKENRVKGWGQEYSLVLRYADAITLDICVGDEISGVLRDVGMNEREMVELTAVVAAYNCVCRVLVALDVGGKKGKGEGLSEVN